MGREVELMDGPEAGIRILQEGLQHPGKRLFLRYELCSALVRAKRGADARKVQSEMARLAPQDPKTLKAGNQLSQRGL